MEFHSKNEGETFSFGEKMGASAESGDIICLIGDLGAGKTVFTKGFARGLGIIGQITSPTFTFLNEYEGRLPLYHFDAYRLYGSEQAGCFDFEEYFDYGGVCVIEWAQNIAGVIPERAMFIAIERHDCEEKERKISVMPFDEGCEYITKTEGNYK